MTTWMFEFLDEREITFQHDNLAENERPAPNTRLCPLAG